MKSSIVVHEQFEYSWPFAVDRFHELWKAQGSVEVIRIGTEDTRNLGDIVENPEEVDRLISLKIPVTPNCIKTFPNLKEAVLESVNDKDVLESAEQAGIRVYRHNSEGFWGQSVSECALALTLCGLRRIPQLHHEIITDHEPWHYDKHTSPAGYIRAGQFCDDPRFTNGTAEGKRVRIVGAGNIGSRYAGFMSMLGADVATWDPFATDPCFHRAGAKKNYHLDDLVKDAEIFAPMVPLRDSTRGIVTGEHIRALPKGCLVVMVTRAHICDMNAVRERVLADEIALAADVHDDEPIALDDPLLGRHNVVHTPHIAGRTKDANIRRAEMLAEQFSPR
jgi:phosphoglycerate dehydrogenase-like enzyme